ncbi:response regulator [Desulfonema magnum]|uniref:Two component system response regulator reciever and HD domains-containing protein n=1 Tax=Desulfonema magnum TaxID=45655 RepID=A0A975BTP7_9BACT|nr:two-component system response regulator [Desulfonema magnum]QTA91433.1 Two component system response regulator reciever and HD domains-containing protein [Desulfonema magnum]
MKDLGTCRILIVDDTKTNIDVLIQALKNTYKLGVALNGPKAIEYVRTNQPDLILLDILMPEMDGFEVCQKLKTNPDTRDIPIIFITAVDSSGEKSKGFEMGAVDYITKPFDITEVKARVKTHLSLKIAQEALKNQNVILEQKVRERTRELEEAQIEILERLERAAEYRDEKTGRHIKRISEYCRLLGKAAGLRPEECNLLSLASTMHDLGKIGIPDTILLKPDKLTPEERMIMETHTTIGAKLLSGSEHRFLKEAEIIALTHHEKWDGTGYPHGLKGEDIPLFGRMLCICDVFDALISERPYKKAWPLEKTLEEIKAGRGTHFDPELADLFVRLEPELRKIVNDLD